MLQLLRSTRRMIYLMGKFLAIFRTRKIPIIKSIKKALALPRNSQNLPNHKLTNTKTNIITKTLNISRLTSIIALRKILFWNVKRHCSKRWDGKKTNASKQLTKSMRKKYKNIVWTKLNSTWKGRAIVVISSSVFSVSFDPTASEQNEQNTNNKQFFFKSKVVFYSGKELPF